MKFQNKQTSRIGFQSKLEEIMWSIPFLDAVAGEALSILCSSNMILHDGYIGMRFTFANVKLLLLSSTDKFQVQVFNSYCTNRTIKYKPYSITCISIEYFA